MDVCDFNLRHLLAVVKIAELGTMNAAADAVNLSQPAITQALARIESLLGAKLFDRLHTGMVQTEEARLFVPRVRAALDHVAGHNVTMSRVRALLALADAGSYSGASQATGLAPPSLHRAVNDLSLSLRRCLIERRGRTVVLTAAGVQVARGFRLARRELENAVLELRALQGCETRRIVIGAMPLARSWVLPTAITRFLRRNPQVRISIIEGARFELIESLRNGTIDLMIGALREPLLESDIVQQPLFQDLPIVVARKGHPLEGCTPTLEELARYPWIVSPPGTPLRTSWELMFQRTGLALPATPIESGSVMAMRQLLVDSDFLTLLSRHQVAVELEANWLVTLCAAPSDLQRTIGISTRDSWIPTAVQTEFVGDLHAAAGH